MKKVANDYIAVNIACILIFYCSLQNVFKTFSDQVRIALTEDGVPMSVLREISLLRHLGEIAL